MTLFRSDSVEIWEVRYPDVRRGDRPFSTALFRHYDSAEAFASHYKGKATINRLERTSEEVALLQAQGYLERVRGAVSRRGGGGE